MFVTDFQDGEDSGRTLDHQNLDAYQVAMDFAVHVDEVLAGVAKETAHIVDQLKRSSTSVPLNIAEGCGRSSAPDRARFFKIAKGSALESSASLDFLLRTKRIKFEDYVRSQMLLKRVVAMLSGLIKSPEKKKK
jgi:four helix bundle protein